MPHEPRGRRLNSGARGLALAFALLLALPLALGAADQVWEGNAAVVRKGEFGTPGFFAASDSFPRNTLIQVENPQNGTTVQVTVVERINGRGNVFLLLSEQAAAALGFSASEVIRVRSRVLVAGGAGRGSEDLAASPDSDVNPAAALADLPAAAGGDITASEARAPEPAAAEQAAEAGEQPMPEEPPAVAMTPAEAPVAQPGASEPQAATAAEPSSTDKRLEELAGRMPQKQLFRPPQASEAVAAAPPAEAAPEETLAPSEPPVEEAPAEPPVEEPPPEPSLAQPEAASTQEAPLAEAQAEEEAPALSLGAPSSQAEEGQVEGLHEPGAEAEAPSVAETPPAVEEQAPAVPAPEPAAPPPAPIVEPAPAEPEAPAQVAAVPAAPLAPEPGREPAIAAAAELLRRSFYLQLGAYSTRGLADKLARELSSTARYTVAVLPVSSGNRLLYKVLIGPLNRDESGTLLFQFRARGFKDAFVQYVE